MGGSTKVVDTTPSDVRDLRKRTSQFLLGGGGGTPTTWGMSGGPQGQSFPTTMGTGLDRIFAGGQPGFDRTVIDRPGAVQEVTGSTPTSVGVGDIREIGGGIPTATTDFLSQLGGPLSRGSIRDVGAVGIRPGGDTQSVDQLGGANSAFFQNMVAQLQPAFAQQRSEALAAAKESAGNLTGSGFANSLGTAVNRSLGDEQARLADYALRGLQLETGRQAGDAARRTQEGIAQGGLDLAVGQSNQGADVQFLDQLLRRGSTAAGLQQAGELANINRGLAIDQSNQARDQRLAELGVDVGKFNTSTAMQQEQFMNELNTAIRTGNRDAVMNVLNKQAELDSSRNSQIYGTQSELANQNAQRFLQLLSGMTTTGVGPGEVVKSGGVGGLLGGLATLGGSFLGGPGGGAIGKKLFGGGQ